MHERWKDEMHENLWLMTQRIGNGEGKGQMVMEVVYDKV